jgi:pilus assembly protein CpaE
MNKKPETVTNVAAIRVSVISASDTVTSAIREALEGDARFSGLTLRLPVHAHALDTEQLEELRKSESQVIVLDLSDDPDRALRAASAVASGNPRATLIGVGPDLQSEYLLNAMRVGMAEYLPSPLDAPALRDALGRLTRKRGWVEAPDAPRDGKLYSFFSAKGGSGSTAVVTNLAIELHRLTGGKTLIVDLDLELGEISAALGLRPRFHFVDLIRNFHRMDEDLLPSYIESHESGVQVLSAPFEPEIGEEVTGEQITQILAFLRGHFDYVLVDTSKSLAPPALAALQDSDLIYLVTNMDVPSLRNLKRCLPILDRVTASDVDRLRLIVNRYNQKSLVRLDDLEETLGLEVYRTLPNDYETVIQSISTGQPLVLNSDSKLAQQLKDLARDMVGGPKPSRRSGRSFVGRLLSPFSTKRTRSAPHVTSGAVEAPAHG